MEFLNTKEAAKFLRLSHRTLERWRLEGRGPKFYRFGYGTGRVLYLRSDLEEWAAQQARTSTSDMGQQVTVWHLADILPPGHLGGFLLYECPRTSKGCGFE